MGRVPEPGSLDLMENSLLKKEKQNVCSATLIVLGNDLEPDLVSPAESAKQVLTVDQAGSRRPGEPDRSAAAGMQYLLEPHLPHGAQKWLS